MYLHTKKNAQNNQDQVSKLHLIFGIPSNGVYLLLYIINGERIA